MSETRSGFSLLGGMHLSGMSWEELWLRQVAIGGAAASVEVEAYVLGVLEPDNHQHDVLAQAINEHFLEQGLNHPVAYSEAVRPAE